MERRSGAWVHRRSVEWVKHRVSDSTQPHREAQQHRDAEESSTIWTLLGGAALLLGATAIWVALTLATDRTYHLAPVVIAAAPGVAARALERKIPTGLALIPGLVAVAVGWALIVAADAEPTATLAEDQPGGVTGEVVIGALVGAAGSVLVAGSHRRGSAAESDD